ncbi:MAG: transcription antitermination factor NusB [Chloroflexi bacterium]|nr:transcription antitermination factor NusB [Chloroflexota bacterium]
MRPRRRARIVALQALFEVDMARHDPQQVLQTRIDEERLAVELQAFTQALVYGSLSHIDVLDEVIRRMAPDWPVEQMPGVDRSILRMAVYEILYPGDTPAKVVINEAVELAKLFGSDSSSRFVNGVLGTLVSHQQDIVAKLGLAID